MVIHYTENGQELTNDVPIADSSYLYKEIMGDNNIVLNFSLPYFVDFPVGSWIAFSGVNYTTLELGNVTKQNERWYDYTLTFESPQKSLTRYKFRNHVDGRLNFTLTAKPQEFLDHICRNMNMDGRDSGWEVGDCIVATEKTISFSHNTILDALNSLAETFGTEWEIIGKKISLKKVEYNRDEQSVLELSYGKGNGFISGISRQLSGEKAVDVLWTEGGERNIDSLTYTYSKSGQTYHANKLRLPRSENFIFIPSNGNVDASGNVERGTLLTAAEWAAADRSVYKEFMPVRTDADGFGIRRSKIVEVNDEEEYVDGFINNGYEESLSAENVYPHKVLTVTRVSESDHDNHFWEIVAAQNTVDYKQCLIGGEDATIIFQTGMLEGKEFNWSAYYHSDKQFDIVPQAIDGITMPDRDSGYHPQVGDEFAVFHVNLPQEYIREAELELLLTGCEYLYQHGEVEVEFNGTIDSIWANRIWDSISAQIRLGGYVNFTDNALCRDGKRMRILSIKQYITNPHAPEITLSNSSVTQGISAEFKKISTNQVAARSELTGYAQLTERSFNKVLETAESIRALADKYKDYFTEGITPILVKTMQTIVGNEELQFEFGLVSTSLVSGRYKVDTFSPYQYEPRKVSDTIVLDKVHMRHFKYSAAADTVTSATATVDQYPYWELPQTEFASSAMPDDNSAYYLYIKAAKSALNQRGYITQNAQFVISATTLQHTSSDFYFEMGIFNSALNGERSFAPLYGYTEVSGGRISTSMIRSKSGKTYIDLDNDIISGYFNFKDGLVAGKLKVGSSDQSAIAGIGGDYAYWAGKTRFTDYITQGYPLLPVFSVKHDGCLRIANDNGVYFNVGGQYGDKVWMKKLRVDGIASCKGLDSSGDIDIYNANLKVTGNIIVTNGRVKTNYKVGGGYAVNAISPCVLCDFTATYNSSSKIYSVNTHYKATTDGGTAFYVTGVSRISTGYIRAYFSTSFSSAHDYYIVAHGIGDSEQHPFYVTIQNQQTQYFEALISDDSTRNDANAHFVILGYR